MKVSVFGRQILCTVTDIRTSLSRTLPTFVYGARTNNTVELRDRYFEYFQIDDGMKRAVFFLCSCHTRSNPRRAYAPKRANVVNRTKSKTRDLYFEYINNIYTSNITRRRPVERFAQSAICHHYIYIHIRFYTQDLKAVTVFVAIYDSPAFHGGSYHGNSSFFFDLAKYWREHVRFIQFGFWNTRLLYDTYVFIFLLSLPRPIYFGSRKKRPHGNSRIQTQTWFINKYITYA